MHAALILTSMEWKLHKDIRRIKKTVSMYSLFERRLNL